MGEAGSIRASGGGAHRAGTTAIDWDGGGGMGVSVVDPGVEPGGDLGVALAAAGPTSARRMTAVTGPNEGGQSCG